MKNQENIRLFISLGLAGLLIAATLWLLGRVIRPEKEYSGQFQPNSASIVPSVPSYINSPLKNRMSLGEKVFVREGRPPDKDAGSKAFEAGDFSTAVSKFQLSLQAKRNDPETLIYLNNAKIGKSQSLKVAVIVPIGISLNEAEETLRGVAQAQDEVNSSGGINGLPLQLEIISIDNFDIVKELSTELVQDSSVVGVVGFSRDPSIFNKGGLVMLSTINPKRPSQPTKYVFYATQKFDVFSDTIASYIVQKNRLTNIAICSDSTFIVNQEKVSQEIVQQYTDSIKQYGGKVTSTACDLSAPDFQPSAFLSQAISDGAEGLILIPRPDKLNLAIDVARENKGRLPLFSYQGMYTEKTLKYGQADVKGMVLGVSWHNDVVGNKSFAQKAVGLWGGEVSPRTATAYDALQTIVTGLKEGNTRQELQKALSNPNFSALGATGKIQFSQTGDRKGGVFLVKVEPCNPTQSCNSSTRYRFRLLE